MDSTTTHLRRIGIPLAPSFLRGHSHFLPFIWQETGFQFPTGAILMRTRTEELNGVNISTIAILIEGKKTFSFKTEGTEELLQTFISTVNYASTMKFPIILKQAGNLLVAKFYPLDDSSNKRLVKFFDCCVPKRKESELN